MFRDLTGLNDQYLVFSEILSYFLINLLLNYFTLSVRSHFHFLDMHDQAYGTYLEYPPPQISMHFHWDIQDFSERGGATSGMGVSNYYFAKVLPKTCMRM